MDCKEARPLLDADLDRELPPSDALRVAQHLDGCAACRDERDGLALVGRAVRHADYHRAPDMLRARIVAGLPGTMPDGAAAAARSPGGWRARWRNWLGAGGGPRGADRPQHGGATTWPGAGWLAGLALATCAVGAGVALTQRHAGADALVDELVASHVRAELSGRDIDVVSTDQHTVKPWFNGRLDYAPPVEDLAASGFVLTGGRLDYVDHRRVAVLIYRYRKHVIDVYVLPGAAAPFATVSQGYALERWPAAGMTWWAVTDAEPAALAAFRSALAARLPGGGTE
ncbi:anti-sigma factor family protein [Burkholderia alba]|uniref:anti-sigma factor family protein n=1 Tax=Burkholderia alba TaxID=2683677 RepID=UPI002B05CAAC|nr:zf-HC2 domain-containing protein [Burkholderia alba]